MSQLSLKNPAHFLALGFGAGLMPKAPGTWGTLVGVPIYGVMATYLSFVPFLIMTSFFFILGCYACHVTGKALGEADHGSIVWDEIVGFLVTMLAQPCTVTTVTIGFLLFRFFDIVKPFPIRYFDRHYKNGFGVMLDDLLAGIMANIGLQAILYFLPWSLT